MKNASLLGRTLIVALVALLQVSALAYVDMAPSWRDASNPSTTLSTWTFADSTQFGIAPAGYNAYGTAGDDWYANVFPSPATQTWIETLNDGSDAYGIWALSGTVVAVIPNTEVTGDGTSKTMQIQLIWKPQVGYTLETQNVLVSIEDNAWTTQTFTMADAEVITLDNGWYQSIWTVEWTPNPTAETVTITGNIYVDALIVDTICIPEPATLAIMGMGIAAMLRIRKK